MQKHFCCLRELISQLRPSVPILCFKPEKIHSAVMVFKNGFPGEISWSVKANPHPEVLKAVLASGVTQFDVASKYEIELVQSFSKGSVLHFNNPIKSPEDIEFAYFKAQVKNFTVDSLEEVEKIKGILIRSGTFDFRDVTLLVRFREPNCTGTGNYNFGTKFGATPSEAAMILKKCFQEGFKVGLTFHSGSQNRNPDVYRTMMKKAHEITSGESCGEPVQLIRLNVGGGFPCRYPHGLEPDLQDYFTQIKKCAKLFNCEIICEPGRAIVSDSIHLLARVNLRRRDENRVYINDGFYGSFMELPFVDFSPPVRAYRSNGTLIHLSKKRSELFGVWGPTCDSLDKLRQPLLLPSSINTGDYLEFGLMGAYTNATQTSFNGMPAAELVKVKTLDGWTSGPDIAYPQTSEVLCNGETAYVSQI